MLLVSSWVHKAAQLSESIHSTFINEQHATLVKKYVQPQVSANGLSIVVRK